MTILSLERADFFEYIFHLFLNLTKKNYDFFFLMVPDLLGLILCVP
jgi:hypothetical protein